MIARHNCDIQVAIFLQYRWLCKWPKHNDKTTDLNYTSINIQERHYELENLNLISLSLFHRTDNFPRSRLPNDSECMPFQWLSTVVL